MRVLQTLIGVVGGAYVEDKLEPPIWAIIRIISAIIYTGIYYILTLSYTKLTIYLQVQWPLLQRCVCCSDFSELRG